MSQKSSSSPLTMNASSDDDEESYSKVNGDSQLALPESDTATARKRPCDPEEEDSKDGSERNAQTSGMEIDLKEQIRMEKNRLKAKKARDRKKHRIASLEERENMLSRENEKLKRENMDLRVRLMQSEHARQMDQAFIRRALASRPGGMIADSRPLEINPMEHPCPDLSAGLGLVMAGIPTGATGHFVRPVVPLDVPAFPEGLGATRAIRYLGPGAPTSEVATAATLPRVLLNSTHGILPSAQADMVEAQPASVSSSETPLIHTHAAPKGPEGGGDSK